MPFLPKPRRELVRAAVNSSSGSAYRRSTSGPTHGLSAVEFSPSREACCCQGKQRVEQRSPARGVGRPPARGAGRVPLQVKDAVDAVSWANFVAFIVLALVAIRQWRHRKKPRSAWPRPASPRSASSSSPAGFSPPILTRSANASSSAPTSSFCSSSRSCLYRFTAAFDPASRGLTRLIGAMTAILVVWTAALPRLPTARRAAAPLVRRVPRRVPRALDGPLGDRRDAALESRPGAAARRKEPDAPARRRGRSAHARARPRGRLDGAHSPLALSCVGLLATVSAVAFLARARAAGARPDAVAAPSSSGYRMQSRR